MSECIDRESIRRVLMDVCSDENCPMFIAATVDQMIDYEPAADVAPVVHAYWKGYHTQDPYCSNCGFSYEREEGESAQTTDYCGNCGAKMDENEVENLNRCPCGDRQYCPEVEKDENGKWFIRCYRCGKIVWGNTIEEAVNAWNGSQNCGAETGGGE
jgi:DNA-directed RNA polymerase subunit RPC12/RpoP